MDATVGGCLILHGDCIELMAEMESDSVDAIVTDAPYGLEFMGKEWDNFAGNKWSVSDGLAGCGFKHRPKPQYIAGANFQAWVTQWAVEALRVLKPGGSLLSFGGTRTFHRLTCGLEDAGFIIKDCLMWLYGQGFPKAQDLGKMIDKRLGAEREVVGTNPNSVGRTSNITGGNYGNSHPDDREAVDVLTAPASDLARHWDGYKIGGIKPAWEPIIWAVKPPEGAWIDNVLKYGTGSANVDECRVGYSSDSDREGANCSSTWHGGAVAFERSMAGHDEAEVKPAHPKGRFPANLLLSHHPKCRQEPSMDSVAGLPRGEWEHECKKLLKVKQTWSCHPDCPVRLLDEQSGVSKAGTAVRHNIGVSSKCHVDYKGHAVDSDMTDDMTYGDTGGASRFFFVAKGENDDISDGDNSCGDSSANHFNATAISHSGVAGEPLREAVPVVSQEVGQTEVRFRYTSKATDRQSYNDHPTLKPTDLIEWLIRLVTRPGQTVLDPFAGSGTTGVAAIHSAREFILIEQDEHYCEIAERRTTENVQGGMF